jgi:sugar/nucleoside kinase (ribokinase family)
MRGVLAPRGDGDAGVVAPPAPAPASSRLAAAVRRLARLASATSGGGSPTATRRSASRARAVVVGGMILDIQARPDASRALIRGSSTPGVVRQTPGGVGRNVAEGVARFRPPGAPAPLLVSVVGDDPAGAVLRAHWVRDVAASDTAIRVVSDAATPVVSAVLEPGGEVYAAVADVRSAERALPPEWVRRFRDDVRDAAVLVLDANCAGETLRCAAELAKGPPGKEAGLEGWSRRPRGARRPIVWFEPVSVAKSTRASDAGILAACDWISPNVAELRAMAKRARAQTRDGFALAGRGGEHSHSGGERSASADESFASAREAAAATAADVAATLDAGVGRVALTLGALGALLCERGVPGDPGDPGDGTSVIVAFTHVPAVPVRRAVSLVGAGDAFVAGCVAALCAGRPPTAAAAAGSAAAKRAVETEANVAAGEGGGLEALEADAEGVMRGVTRWRVRVDRGG